MRIVVVRWLLLPFFQFFRWSLVILLWLATLAAFTLGVSSLARIFTGDAQFGALDGIQFTEALYQAVFRFIVVAVLVLLLQRLLRWRPGRWLKSWLERAETARQERRDRAAVEALATLDEARSPGDRSEEGTEQDAETRVDRRVGGEGVDGEQAETDDDDDDDAEYELVPAKPKLKGRPRAWVVHE